MEEFYSSDIPRGRDMEKSSSGSRRQRQTKRVGERERRRVKESERETGTLRFTERKKQR